MPLRIDSIVLGLVLYSNLGPFILRKEEDHHSSCLAPLILTIAVAPWEVLSPLETLFENLVSFASNFTSI